MPMKVLLMHIYLSGGIACCLTSIVLILVQMDGSRQFGIAAAVYFAMAAICASAEASRRKGI